MNQIPQQPVRQKTPRVRDKAYMGFVGALGNEQNAGCVVCGGKPCEVAHYRGGEVDTEWEPSEQIWEPGGGSFTTERPGWRYGKAPATKHDRFVLPLCHPCHRTAPHAQHHSNERLWWAARQIDPLALCKSLQDIYDSNPMPRALELGTALLMEGRR